MKRVERVSDSNRGNAERGGLKRMSKKRSKSLKSVRIAMLREREREREI